MTAEITSAADSRNTREFTTQIADKVNTYQPQPLPDGPGSNVANHHDGGIWVQDRRGQGALWERTKFTGNNQVPRGWLYQSENERSFHIQVLYSTQRYIWRV